MSDPPLTAKGGSELKTFRTMDEAFAAACRELHDEGQPSVIYEVIANRIIAAVVNDEDDPTRSRDAGLAALWPWNRRTK
jgi:hypothetical protein